MEIKITKNDSAKEGFFDNYALQTVVQLDGEKCKNILSDGATVANVGGVKQLVHDALQADAHTHPGEEGINQQRAGHKQDGKSHAAAAQFHQAQ